MRNIKSVKINPKDFKAVPSAIKIVLSDHRYDGYVTFEKGVYHLFKVENIKTFCEEMGTILKECEESFTHVEAVEEQLNDRKILKNILDSL